MAGQPGLDMPEPGIRSIPSTPVDRSFASHGRIIAWVARDKSLLGATCNIVEGRRADR
jgi:hypothetical protein